MFRNQSNWSTNSDYKTKYLSDPVHFHNQFYLTQFKLSKNKTAQKYISFIYSNGH